MVMMPMTRNRASADGVGPAMMETCYRQRASAGLIVTELVFLANPDLVRRYRDNLPLNATDPATFYGGDEKGYIDHPLYRSEYLAA
jgi:2,4-dienoyl-CoA reductase-like NADH-dependent reductase (Old Yellow Enzyme family)